MNTKKTPSNLSPAAQQHLENAYRLEGEGALKAALRECEAAIALIPDWAEAHNLRGVILDGLHDTESAAKAYRQAVRLDPEFKEARDNLAEAEAELNAGSAKASPPKRSAKISQPKSRVPAGRVICKGCGLDIWIGHGKCWKCGTPLDDEPAERERDEAHAPPSDESAEAVRPVPEPEEVRDDLAEAETEPKVSGTQIPTPTPRAPAGRVICKGCGLDIWSGYEKCWKCGTPLGDEPAGRARN